MIKKYSKSSGFYLSTKSDFFSSNDEMLKRELEHNQFYSSQPKRKSCKLCKDTLPKSVDFSSHGVEYVFCNNCNHLNGIYEDTQAFVEHLYMVDDGVEYASNYLDENFEKRAVKVYLPKVDFLVSVLPPKLDKILDVGCGSGYFVYAALLRNLKPKGLDVSKTMVEFGNSQINHLIGAAPLKVEKEEGFYEEIKNSEAEVVSAIGVIEHLREPHKFFDAFKMSKAKYLYYSVPMFSLSVFLENVSNDIFPRQLSGGHTHLFTEESINEMHRMIGISSIGEWRFGVDFMDLYRHLMVKLQSQNASKKMIGYLYDVFGAKIDELQNVLDANHSCSEIHVVAVKDEM
ncbi:class I SAM-dependent methyltransferase [Thalassospira sp. MA62]|nr:class I SAM-dependent methyltransferase [Thalassospira sp. MA62]